MVKLLEECVGNGELIQDGESTRQVAYRVRRFQGMTEGSGMPIPGLFRIEGSIALKSEESLENAIGSSLRLRLEDGRVLAITVIDRDGNVLSEGHGPTKCMCC
jgi:hypothetical protein